MKMERFPLAIKALALRDFNFVFPFSSIGYVFLVSPELTACAVRHKTLSYHLLSSSAEDKAPRIGNWKLYQF